MSIDVTDATFQTEVVDRSQTTPVVVDLWAPWCGPCKQLGPILEKVIDATEGRVVLAKVNVDENPQVSRAFQVQGIPAVYALSKGQVVDGFVGAQGEAAVTAFVATLDGGVAPSEADVLVAAGDEASLRQALELERDHPAGVLALAELLVGRGDTDEGLALLERLPESAETVRIAAQARLGSAGVGDVETTLNRLLTLVKGDDDARQEYLDVLALMGPDDPRTLDYRRKLTSALF